ncbi:EAL domain-containing protein [Enterobacter asburiae]|uniref:EAL domain-containing protein n=1 Tax=Enterobacter asburiae TaxID=61645 RepID=UPI0034E8D989|nr:EAL domain-containing protein [Enterobacter asburiae]
MITLNGVPLTFKLEPIIDMFSQKVIGYEILSKPEDNTVNTEAFFLSLPVEILGGVFYEQLRFFTAQCTLDPERVRNLFINLPLCLLLREGFLRTLPEYLTVTDLNLEIQYDPVTLTPEVIDYVKTLLPEGVRLWIDDVDACGGSILNDPSGPGIKIDKEAFWSMYRSQAQLSVLTHCSDERVIVEGVETAEHINYLKDNRVCFGQGYYWPAIEYR